MSPKKYINYIKLSKAKDLLIESGFSINTIAYEVGFSDPGYFGRLFKKEFGESPEKWRQMKRPMMS